MRSVVFGFVFLCLLKLVRTCWWGWDVRISLHMPDETDPRADPCWTPPKLRPPIVFPLVGGGTDL